MAFDKVVDSAVLNANLKAVADAIRAKTGTTSSLTFPSDFVSKINGIEDKDDYLASVINKTCTELVNDKIKVLTSIFQQGNTNLVTVDLPALTETGESVFSGCNNITTLNLPSLAKMTSGTFGSVNKITQLCLPSLVTMKGWGYNFNQCYGFKRMYFPKLENEIGNSDFNNCNQLETFILGANVVVPMTNANAFNQTPIKLYNNKVGYVYVPRARVDDYKKATNWSTYASQIRAIEDYPEVLEGWT